MKKFMGVSAALIFFCASACTLNAASVYYSEDETSEKVICVHQFNLKPGLDAEAFEHFILTELAPLYNEVQGQQASLAIGDRGIRSGKYAFILTFDSVKDRDHIYPPEGGISEDFQKILEGKDDLWDKLGSFLEGDPFGNHTDYVTIMASD